LKVAPVFSFFPPLPESMPSVRSNGEKIGCPGFLDLFKLLQLSYTED